VGWSASTTKDVTFVEQCLTMALGRRDHTDRPVPPAESTTRTPAQYTSVRFTETLALDGLSASIGSIGDAYDNAAAETVFGLFKNEAVASGSAFRTGPLRHLADVEALTMNYIHWSTPSGPTSTSTTSPPQPPSNLITICEPWQQPGDSRHQVPGHPGRSHYSVSLGLILIEPVDRLPVAAWSPQQIGGKPCALGGRVVIEQTHVLR